MCKEYHYWVSLDYKGESKKCESVEELVKCIVDFFETTMDGNNFSCKALASNGGWHNFSTYRPTSDNMLDWLKSLQVFNDYRYIRITCMDHILNDSICFIALENHCWSDLFWIKHLNGDKLCNLQNLSLLFIHL